MDDVGIDVHKQESEICVLTEAGEVQTQRIRTRRDALAAVFGGRARARILIEASTESEWVAQCLEALGQAVIVADPGMRRGIPDGGGSRRIGGMRKPWRWRAGRGPIARCTGCRRRAGPSGSSDGCGRRWWRRGRGRSA